MAETYDIEITVVSQKGTCGADIKWAINGLSVAHAGRNLSFSLSDNGINIDVLKYGGTFPWSKTQILLWLFARTRQPGGF